MIRFRIKRIFAVLIILGGLYLTLSWGLTKRTMVIYQNDNSRIYAKIPFSFIMGILVDFRYTIILTSPRIQANLSLLFNSFERPLFCFFSEKQDTLFIVYNRDTEYLFLSLRYQDRSHQFDFASDRPLQRVITSRYSQFTVRHSTREELSYLFSEIAALPLEKYIQLSVPTFDIGFYKAYLPQDRMMSLLNWKIGTFQSE